MLWFFENGDKRIRLETRYDNVEGHYVAILRWPDGMEQVDRFTDDEAFRQHLIALETELAERHYKQDGGPAILPDGWRSLSLGKDRLV